MHLNDTPVDLNTMFANWLSLGTGVGVLLEPFGVRGFGCLRAARAFAWTGALNLLRCH